MSPNVPRSVVLLDTPMLTVNASSQGSGASLHDGALICTMPSPAAARKFAGTGTCSTTPDTSVGSSWTSFQMTFVSGVKPVPISEMVVAADPGAICAGSTPVNESWPFAIGTFSTSDLMSPIAAETVAEPAIGSSTAGSSWICASLLFTTCVGTGRSFQRMTMPGAKKNPSTKTVDAPVRTPEARKEMLGRSVTKVTCGVELEPLPQLAGATDRATISQRALDAVIGRSPVLHPRGAPARRTARRKSWRLAPCAGVAADQPR